MIGHAEADGGYSYVALQLLNEGIVLAVTNVVVSSDAAGWICAKSYLKFQTLVPKPTGTQPTGLAEIDSGVL